MLTVGIYGDLPSGSTGMAIVCRNLAKELAKKHIKVIYFGRFGQKKWFSPTLQQFDTFFYVPCQGGVWDLDIVLATIKKYHVDVVFTEDDWFSADPIVRAAKHLGKLFHFLTPIDSLPINIFARKIFKYCDKIYVPNSSWRIIQKWDYPAVYLPHGVNVTEFKPINQKFDKFCFVWVGRDDKRKALGRAILAFEKMYKEVDAVMLIHTDWVQSALKTPNAQNTYTYIKRHKLPIVCSQMEDVPHVRLNQIYNLGHVNLCTSKAGACEMSILEAAACELPSLVTNWTFMRENIIDGKTGFLVNWNKLIREPEYRRIWANIDVSILAEKMLWCAKHPDEVREMGKQAKEHVTANFIWKNSADILYRNIMESVECGKK